VGNYDIENKIKEKDRRKMVSENDAPCDGGAQKLAVEGAPHGLIIYGQIEIEISEIQVFDKADGEKYSDIRNYQTGDDKRRFGLEG
jgi:hypothetical protein